jgi:uncharacterized protein
LIQPIRLIALDGLYGVCRLNPAAEIPAWAGKGEFQVITRSSDELSIICLEAQIPTDVKWEGGWRVLKMAGPFEFSEIGILSGILAPFAKAGISILAVSTFDTDYVLIKADKLQAAGRALAGSRFTLGDAS